MKKIVGIVLASLMVLSLTACGGAGSVAGHVKSFEDARPLYTFASYEEKRYSDDVKYSDIDMVIFGSYPQSDATGNKKEPIYWIPVNKNEKERKIYLMSKDILDGCVYEYRNDALQNNGYLRKHSKDLYIEEFLNGEFFDKAFSDEEKSMIEVIGSSNDERKVVAYNIGGKGIEGFYQIMKAKPTKYAQRTIVFRDREEKVTTIKNTGCADWWYDYEIPTEKDSDAKYVAYDGSCFDEDLYFNKNQMNYHKTLVTQYLGVRPFICVKY